MSTWRGRTSLRRLRSRRGLPIASCAGGVLSILIGIPVVRWGGDGFECTNRKSVGCAGDIFLIGGAVLAGVGFLLTRLPPGVSVTQHAVFSGGALTF